MLPSVFPRLATDLAGSVSWCLETSLLKIPFPGRASLPRMELPPHLLCLLFRLLYFFLPVFEDNGLLFWLPDVLCQPTEAVLWSLLSVEMYFWGICEGESGLHVLFLRHLRTAPETAGFNTGSKQGVQRVKAQNAWNPFDYQGTVSRDWVR